MLIFFAKIVFLQSNIQTFAGYAVAPYVGAWIETLSAVMSCKVPLSHPMWVRGLKQRDQVEWATNLLVAPYVGAWIETFIKEEGHTSEPVAPYVGAWIETYLYKREYDYIQSHPMWVRGLKLIIHLFSSTNFRKSHPMWVRGLKHGFGLLGHAGVLASHPMWVRGLKHDEHAYLAC